jgi:hypothetical protein
MPPARPILHLPVLAGACAAAYAATLAFVTGQQADADAIARANRQPLQEAVAAATSERRDAAADIRRAGARLERAGRAYRTALRASASLDGALVALAGDVETATGAAAALPERISLPVPQVQVVHVAAPAVAPPVQAVTGGSGR